MFRSEFFIWMLSALAGFLAALAIAKIFGGGCMVVIGYLLYLAIIFNYRKTT